MKAIHYSILIALVIAFGFYKIQAGSRPGNEAPPPEPTIQLSQVSENEIRMRYHYYNDLREEHYRATSFIKMNVDDLDALIQMARQQGHQEIYFTPAAFTQSAAREYEAANNLIENAALNYPTLLAGLPAEGGGMAPYKIRTVICPPPAFCHGTGGGDTASNYVRIVAAASDGGIQEFLMNYRNYVQWDGRLPNVRTKTPVYLQRKLSIKKVVPRR